MQQTFWPRPSFIVLMSEVAIQKLWLGLVDSRTVSLKKLIKLTFFQKGSDVSCPLHSADFINEIEQIMSQRFHAKTEHDCREPHCKYRQNSTWTVRCGRGREMAAVVFDHKMADKPELFCSSFSFSCSLPVACLLPVKRECCKVSARAVKWKGSSWPTEFFPSL